MVLGLQNTGERVSSIFHTIGPAGFCDVEVYCCDISLFNMFNCIMESIIHNSFIDMAFF